jgi:hypothetical protein
MEKIMNFKVIGIMGNARSGKDTAYLSIKTILNEASVRRVAFADELKKECDKFLKDNVGISSFTECPEEKELIRPFLVTYGTHLRRKIDPECWIKRVSKSMSAEKNSINVITDTRYVNEARWVKEQGGLLIFLSRDGIAPANEDEEVNNPVLRQMADIIIDMPTFQKDYIKKCRTIIKQNLENFQTQTFAS